jgi:pimeloyl-ACP methyl ester carboxylesterase
VSPETNHVPMHGGLLPNPVLIAGSGAPLVFLHGLLGPDWDALLDGLAARHRVYAPANAGLSEPDELKHLDGIYDLVLYYDELFARLGIKQFDLIGHSFGGMVAAEYAAAFPDKINKLVLIDPLGLWRDDAHVGDYLLVTAEQRAQLLLGDPKSASVKARLALPGDEEARIKMMLDRVSTLASVSHFLWPIPERGLKKRLFRITADTLIVWGQQDRMISTVYANDFASLIKRSRVELIADAGHTPQFSQPQAVLDKVSAHH